ncbi:class II aminoacyl-tRNA and biotin synthetasessuperfamily protein [Striga asiatica]|uniref:Class II aminoacyl-tRNA and biotin synthetasessuperfamily protein n=1 Tax=Striga asiatica TaxID=4170 RepID=A0A5A7PZG6_STRAF|nr:class II aminoacyl-tRNA and biotin synthetasessuperfamily protein [Striga asiatica]
MSTKGECQGAQEFEHLSSPFDSGGPSTTSTDADAAKSPSFFFGENAFLFIFHQYQAGDERQATVLVTRGRKPISIHHRNGFFRSIAYNSKQLALGAYPWLGSLFSYKSPAPLSSFLNGINPFMDSETSGDIFKFDQSGQVKPGSRHSPAGHKTAALVGDPLQSFSAGPRHGGSGSSACQHSLVEGLAAARPS